jgi:glycosyltransferase involved in cell wall biosynthesis
MSALKVDSNLKWELIIVDNNSTDNTRAIYDRYQNALPLTYCFERNQGQSAARNRGICEAHGDLLAFTDDDVDVDKEWINAMCKGAKSNPGASFFGGPVFPKWEVPPPAWLARHSNRLLNGMSVHFEQDVDTPNPVTEDLLFFGANMMFRKEIFNKGFRFREDLGLKGNNATRQEDSEFIIQLLKNGYQGIYLPNAKVCHRNPKERMTERYLREWFVGAGKCDVRLGQIVSSSYMLFGAPCYLWRNLLEFGIRYVFTRWTKPSDVWLRAEISMARTWGMIVELRHQTLESSSKC